MKKERKYSKLFAMKNGSVFWNCCKMANNKYRESSLNITSITSKEMWKKGFIMGLRIGVEVMDTPTENLKNLTENTD